MAIISVAAGGNIQAAIDRAQPGDTVQVAAGSYVNQFLSVFKDITLMAVGGFVVMTETVQPPNGKSMIDEGGNVTISGFDISGVTVPDANGAAVRYEFGNLKLNDVYFHNNQDGILGAPDANGSIAIDRSEFAFNGVGGTGGTHDIYIGAIANFTLTNSYIHDVTNGHEVKSRAANNVITNNRIFDNQSSASYSLDLSNGGNATITGNLIEQGPNSPNQNIIAYGEEGLVAGHTNNVSMTGNTIVNDRSGGVGILNPTGVGLTSFAGNSVFGLANPLGGAVLASRPVLDLAPIGFLGGTPTTPTTPSPPPPTPTPPPTPPPPPPPPVLTIDQYHNLMLTDFTAYSVAHPSVWLSSSALSAITFEITAKVIPVGHVAGDLWS
jgi:hypothetical protein